MKARDVAILALMLALALVLQLSPLKVKTPWGMDIDFVAVPMVLLYLLYGLETGFLGLVLLFLGISMVGSSSWLGASMKFLATLSVVLGLELAKRLTHFKVGSPEKYLPFIVLGTVFGILIRAPLMMAMNYYYAIPVWFGVPREQVIPLVEEFTHMPFWLAISLPNAIQTVVDVIGAFLVIVPVLRALPHVVRE
ncbi:ECF transporter S component [Palaeococcus ferrophilus]|uniref:ECF transporter S component n=1 Tax=Palaeococcus ferrophilus TaxID=83868 RepID=UPI00064EBB84|nr:ECF transporter S component [Palaeococcus ferrophilus]